MPDVTLVVRGLTETGESERLERALARLWFVEEVNVDPAKGLVAVSYGGGETELAEIGQLVKEAGYEYKLSPRAGEEVGRLSGQLKEVRAANSRLLAQIKEGLEERRRLTEEVLELRAAAEERLMLMERIERIAGIEQDLAEAASELEELRSRKLLARLLNRR